MPSPKPRHWRTIGQDLTLAALFARRFLELSPVERAALLQATQSEWLPPRGAWQLAMAICQARQLIGLLEEAEAAWVEALAAQMKKN